MFFQACAETLSFRKAGERLGIDAATVARRIDKLEARLGQRVFRRRNMGLHLTDEGRAILDDVAVMNRAVLNITRKVRASSVKGVVRVAITEGLGTYWLLPKLIDFQQANRLLTVDLRATMDLMDVARLEADVSVQFDRPQNPDLIVRRIGRLHTYPYVSPEYDRLFGRPKSIEEARSNHRFIQQAAPTLDESAMARILGVEDVSGLVGIRTNASSAILYAVERGAGIGVLPTYALALGTDLLPVDIGVRYHRDIWLTYHPECLKSMRHRTVIDWLINAFSPAHYHCFRDDFIHPCDLIDLMARTSSNLSVRGYAAAKPFQSRKAASLAPAVDPIPDQ